MLEGLLIHKYTTNSFLCYDVMHTIVMHTGILIIAIVTSSTNVLGGVLAIELLCRLNG